MTQVFDGVPRLRGNQLRDQNRLVAHHPPVVGLRDPEVYDHAYFSGYPKFTKSWTQHNIALKWFREKAEADGVDYVTFSNNAAVAEDLVPEIVHDEGPLFHFFGEPVNPWRWQEMVAPMDASSIRMLVPYYDRADRSGGIKSCGLKKMTVYDHKRHHAQKNNAPPATMMMVWDFEGTLVQTDSHSR